MPTEPRPVRTDAPADAPTSPPADLRVGLGVGLRVGVDGERCMGHGMCEAYAPAVYRVGESGLNEQGEFDVPAELRQDALRGAGACPERVIRILQP